MDSIVHGVTKRRRGLSDLESRTWRVGPGESERTEWPGESDLESRTWRVGED